MPHVETLIPRPALFNTALYAVPAVVYTGTLFALEITRKGHVFGFRGTWRDRFSYLAIVSWPILLFGALILVAVRIGARTRRRSKGKKKNKKNKDSERRERAAAMPVMIPSTRPPDMELEMGLNLTVQGEGVVAAGKHGAGGAVGVMRRRGRRRKRVKLPRGYVSVTRAQKIFAAFGFLWMSVGLGCTCGCGVFVFFGQRERYEVNPSLTGVVEESVWKTLVIPLLTGILPAIVYLLLGIGSGVKFVNVLTASGKMVETPVGSMNDESYGGLDERDLDVEVLFDEPQVPEAIMKRDFVEADEETVERMLRQLRDMGFKNRHENLAALQASSFDLEKASDKLTNVRM